MRGSKQCNRWLRRTALLITAFAAIAPTAGAAVVSDTSPGTNAPPSTLGPYTMTAFAPDGRAPSYNDTVTTAPGPLGDVTFGAPQYHVTVPDWWATWSHGYTGDAYWNGGASSTVMTLPAKTGAFYFYAEPNSGTYDMTATSNSGATATAQVSGSSGAKYFGFYGTAGDTIATITITGNDFAVGEFGTAAAAPAGPTCNGKTPTTGYNYAGNNAPHTINGTAGDDVIYGGNGIDTINGGGGNDTICGVGGDDVVRGGAGDDYVFGGPGADDLGGQAGNDTVSGGAGNDRVNGAEGNDKVAGGDGMDIANGGDGDDNVNGGADDDVLAGNAGNDVCVGNAGNDRTTLNGGCERFDSATVSNNTPATTAAGDKAVVASAEDPDEANGNAATLMPAGTANSGLDVEGGNSTAFGDGV